MRAPTVLRGDRSPLPLGELVGRGGEGEVWAVRGEDGLVAKLYTGNRAPEREPKVKAMLAAAFAEGAKLVSYPSALVLDQRGRFAGFLMRRVAKAKPLHQLYKPVARKRHFPTADFRFLVHVALNVAKAMASVHEAGCVIGDVNESGVLVTEKGVVALIDADSFQVEHGGRRFACEVGKPEYTAPEIQNRPLKDVVRTNDHDTFALAVVVFQLLWMGRHPFSGTFKHGDMQLERSIAEHRFSYSKVDARDMVPPPGVPDLSFVPAEMAAAFEQAFSPSGRNGRPSAVTWVSLLSALQRDLKVCGRNALHHYPRASGACPWCRMRNELGVELFVPPPLDVGEVPAADDWSVGFDIVAVWRAIERVTAPPAASEPAFPNDDVVPSAEARAAKGSRIERKVVGLLALAAAGSVIAFAAALWPVWMAAGWFGLARLLGEGDEGAFTRRYETADRAWAQALAEWRSSNGPERFEAAKLELSKSKAQFEALADEERKRLADADDKRRESHLTSWLEQFQIRRATIKGIGPGKVATLASFGIETAAEISSSRLLRVPGFGQVNSRPLLDWRRRLEVRFRYDPRPNASDLQRSASIKADVAAKAARLRLELQAGPATLAKLAGEIAATQRQPTPELLKLRRERAQAEADLRHLGRAIPSPIPIHIKSMPAPAFARQPINVKRPRYAPVPTASASGRSCPQCGSSMVKRTARRGRNAGGQFWGCSRYPSCKGTRSI